MPTTLTGFYWLRSRACALKIGYALYTRVALLCILILWSELTTRVENPTANTAPWIGNSTSHTEQAGLSVYQQLQNLAHYH